MEHIANSLTLTLFYSFSVRSRLCLHGTGIVVFTPDTNFFNLPPLSRGCNKIFSAGTKQQKQEEQMTRDFPDETGDRVRHRKRAILARINRKYNSNAASLESLGTLSRLHPIDSAGSRSGREASVDSFPSSSLHSSRHILPRNAGGDTREDYIEKLKRRIKQLEQSPMERMGSSRFDFDSDADAGDNNTPPPSRKYHGRSAATAEKRQYSYHEKDREKTPHSKNLKPLSQSQNQSTTHHHRHKSKSPPPKSPPISASGSYDISKYKTLGPIPTSAKTKSTARSSSLSSSAKGSSSIIPETDPNMQLEQCDICMRKFRVERLDKHREACEKASKKRAVFDEQKMRIRGTELENFRKAPSPGGGGYHSDGDSKSKKGTIVFKLSPAIN